MGTGQNDYDFELFLAHNYDYDFVRAICRRPNNYNDDDNTENSVN